MTPKHTELEKIRVKHGGILYPDEVVKAARKQSSPLHSCFTWNNDKAAGEYRLWQARELIQVHCTILEGSDKPVRAYVSLRQDRYKKGGGYRGLKDVLSAKETRALLLAEALADANRWREKYEYLKELSGVFAALDKVKPKKR